jgi:4-hydroxybenzoate polyprenyltransferase
MRPFMVTSIWNSYLRLGQVPVLPTVWTSVLTGIVLAGAALDARNAIPLMLALSVFYVGAMLLTNGFPELDEKRRQEVFARGYGMLGIAVAGLAWIGGGKSWAPVVLGVGFAMIIVYKKIRHKSPSWNPMIMAICRVLIYLTAALSVSPHLPLSVMGGSLVLFCYTIGLGYAGNHSRFFRSRWSLAFLFIPFAYGVPVLFGNGLGTIIYFAFLAWVLYAVTSHSATRLVAGISLLDALLMAMYGAPYAAGLAFIAFGLTLLLQWYGGSLFPSVENSRVRHRDSLNTIPRTLRQGRES